MLELSILLECTLEPLKAKAQWLKADVSQSMVTSSIPSANVTASDSGHSQQGVCKYHMSSVQPRANTATKKEPELARATPSEHV